MEAFMNYTMYHLHSDYSLLDSCTNYKEYIDYASDGVLTEVSHVDTGEKRSIAAL